MLLLVLVQVVGEDVATAALQPVLLLARLDSWLAPFSHRGFPLRIHSRSSLKRPLLPHAEWLPSMAKADPVYICSSSMDL